MSKFKDFDFPELHYVPDKICRCPYSKDDGSGKCKFCHGTSPRKLKEKKDVN